MKKENRLLITKTIYASRKGKTKEEIQDILKLECETHLKAHPDLLASKIDEPVRHADKSMTIFIHFKVNDKWKPSK